MEKYWYTKNGFVNPDGKPTPRGPRFTTLRWLFGRIFMKPYQLGKDVPHDHVLDSATAKKQLAEHQHTNSITWLGHATFLINVNGITIITDPLLFGNPAPRIFQGMKRLPNPIQSSDFTADILLISHDHGDHIHHPSLRSLKDRENIYLITPLNVSKKLHKYNFKQSTELDWFEEHTIHERVTITAVPALHYSDLFNNSLWSGFIISFTNDEGVEQKIYFGGDSGYGDFFKRDIAPYGPFDLAIVGIGSYYLPYPTNAPRIHTNPEQAVQVAQDVRAKKVIPMHWGTTKMADEDPNEQFPRMQKHAEKITYSGDVQKLRIGETIKI